VQRDPLRDHPGTADGVYLPLRRLPAHDKQRVLNRLCARRGAFGVVRGDPKPVQRLADSGSETIWWICPECGSWVCASRPGATVRNVRGGTLDDTSWLRPSVHFWTRNKQPWIAIPEGDQIFETQPADLVRFFYQTG